MIVAVTEVCIVQLLYISALYMLQHAAIQRSFQRCYWTVNVPLVTLLPCKTLSDTAQDTVKYRI